MSMIGNYLRLSTEELTQLLSKPADVMEMLYPNDGNGDHPAGRHLDIDKAWQAIQFLLTGDPWDGPLPLQNAVMGGRELSDEEVGYGPARYLEAPEVKAVSAALALISGDALWSRFDAKAFAEAEIYPDGMTQDAKGYVVGYYEELRTFFADAAEASDAMLLYLN